MQLADNTCRSQTIRSDDIHRYWSRIDDEELAAIRTPADLVMQIQAKYGLDKKQALRAVEVWKKGRSFLGGESLSS